MGEWEIITWMRSCWSLVACCSFLSPSDLIRWPPPSWARFCWRFSSPLLPGVRSAGAVGFSVWFSEVPRDDFCCDSALYIESGLSCSDRGPDFLSDQLEVEGETPTVPPRSSVRLFPLVVETRLRLCHFVLCEKHIMFLSCCVEETIIWEKQRCVLGCEACWVPRRPIQLCSCAPAPDGCGVFKTPLFWGQWDAFHSSCVGPRQQNKHVQDQTVTAFE